MKKKVLTIKEAAQVIDGINEFRIRQMCRSGQLRTFKAGKKFLIAESDLYEAVFGKYEPEESEAGAVEDGGAAAARCSKDTSDSAHDARI